MTQDEHSPEMDPFAELAHACEVMNSFSRSLWSHRRYQDVMTATNLRACRPGWMFENYVELRLNAETGETAAWALEFSRAPGGWRVHTNTSISYGDYDEDVKTVIVPLNGDLRRGLEDCVSSLIATYGDSADFRREIERILAGE